jgi:hypothetical protein
MKKKIAVASVKRAVGTPASSLAAAFGGERIDNRLYFLDLKAGKAIPYAPPDTVKRLDLGYFDPVMSPDGKYVFARGLENIVRYSVEDDKLKYQETSPRIQQGALGAGIQVSPDSKYVCLPSGGGNYGLGYATYVYAVANLKKAEFTVESGAHPQAIGFDPAGAWVYAQGGDKSLMLFSFTGVKKKEYKIGDAHRIKQFLPHPDGNKLLLFTESKLWAVEVPKKD